MHAIQTETGKEYQKFAEFATSWPCPKVIQLFLFSTQLSTIFQLSKVCRISAYSENYVSCLLIKHVELHEEHERESIIYAHLAILMVPKCNTYCRANQM